MPRLSVDLDLVYTKYSNDRQSDFDSINNDLSSIKDRLERFNLHVIEQISGKEGFHKLLVSRDGILVKVEVNYVMRGTLSPVEPRKVSKSVEDQFLVDVTAPLLAESEIYAGKILAALDRQHPRDLFDVLKLYESSGLTDEMIEDFVCYLCCHDRTFGDVLASHDKDISDIYYNEFEGMTLQEVSVDDLIATRSRLRKDILSRLTDNHKTFLLGFALADPDWSLMKYAHLKDIPAVKWKLLNLQKLLVKNNDKFHNQHNLLRQLFQLTKF